MKQAVAHARLRAIESGRRSRARCARAFQVVVNAHDSQPRGAIQAARVALEVKTKASSGMTNHPAPASRGAGEV